MAEIRVEVEGQLLAVQNQEIIASGNVNYDTCAFIFDGAWKGFVKTAVFYQDKTRVQYAVLASDGTCAVPAAAMAEEGNMYIGVFGVSGPKVITSTVERVYIRQGAVSGDTVSGEPGDDIFLAIIAQYQQVMEQMKAYDMKMEEFIGIMNALNAYDVADVTARLDAAEQKLSGMGAAVKDTVKSEISAVSGGLRFAQDGNGEWGYIMPGTVDIIPFSAQGYVKPGQDGDIENALWVQVPSGTYSNFVKAICKSGYPVAITADGTVVFSTDGVSWEKSKPDYPDCKFTDIDWDGERFLIAGSYTDGAARTVGLLLETEDFREYRKLEIPNSLDSDTNYDTCYYAVYPENGKYVVIAVRKSVPERLHVYVGDLENEWKVAKDFFDPSRVSLLGIGVAKSSTGMLMYARYDPNTTGMGDRDIVVRIDSEGVSKNFFYEPAPNDIHVFECRDALYYCAHSKNQEYKLVKVPESGDQIILSTGKNFAFLGGVYFNKCDVFINYHSMLVMKNREGFEEKTLDDLIEISPEAAVSCITKAFGRIYIFGSRGLILVSS